MQCQEIAHRLDTSHVVRRITRRNVATDFPLRPCQLHLFGYARKNKRSAFQIPISCISSEQLHCAKS